MDGLDGDVQIGFLRKRRNLLGISLALLVVHFTGLEIRKINVFGNEVNLTDPTMASYFLWAAWFYFLVRYYLYFHDLPNKGIHDAYLARLHQLMTAAGTQEFRRIGRERNNDVPPAANVHFEAEEVASIRVYPTGWMFRGGGRIVFGQTARLISPFEFIVQGTPLRRAKIRAHLHSWLHKRFLTEYYFPFMFAALPLVLLMWSTVPMTFPDAASLVWLIPMGPILVRAIVALCHRPMLDESLSEEELARDQHRSVILTLEGFSFTGVLGLAVLDRASGNDFGMAIYFLLVAFLGYHFPRNLQSYKHKRWHDLAGDALMDAASLSLILSIVSVIRVAEVEIGLQRTLSVIAIGFWLLDFAIRVRLQWRYLHMKGAPHARKR
jgi:hypothetical protein